MPWKVWRRWPATRQEDWRRLWCGGDRDPGKRPIMGEIAAAGWRPVIVTDDNPRSETRRDFVRRYSRRAGRDEIGDRRKPSRRHSRLGVGDISSSPARGMSRARSSAIRRHSTTPSVVRAVVAEMLMTRWDRLRTRRWRPARPGSRSELGAGGVSIDTRAVARNDLFVALKGPRFDGHDSSGQRWQRRGGGNGDRPMPDADPTGCLP